MFLGKIIQKLFVQLLEYFWEIWHGVVSNEEVSECKIFANERKCHIDRYGDLRCYSLTKNYRGCKLQNGTEIKEWHQKLVKKASECGQ